MNYTDLTKKQQEILDYIKSEVLLKGYPPSVRDISIAVHLRSASSIQFHLRVLEKKGYLHRSDSKPRALKVTGLANESEQPLVSVPLFGEITGKNMSGQSRFIIPEARLPEEPTFMIRAERNDMKNSGIFAGDLVVAARTEHIKDGDAVIVFCGKDVLIRKYTKCQTGACFQTEDGLGEPVFLENGDFEILGTVVGVMRFYDLNGEPRP